MYTPSKSICEPFVLNKENILRILEIIEKRRPSDASANFNPIFSYKRLDDYSHETNNVDVLFHEDNCGNARIVQLEIHSGHFRIADKSLNYSITFTSFEDNEENDLGFSFFKSIEIEIKGENRDDAELLFNELDKYIENTVISSKNRWVVKLLKSIESIRMLFVIPVLLLIPVLKEIFKSDAQNVSKIIDEALQSSDLQTKLDAILLYCQNTNRLGSFSGASIFAIVCLTAVVLMLLFGGKLLPKLHSLYPFVFDFGVSAKDYQSRVRVLKWLIGVIGSLVLGVLGNIIYAAISQFV